VPIIPATWEIETGVWRLESRLGKVRLKPYLKNKLARLALLVHKYNPNYLGDRDQD
jgi:hypothetical protein